MQPFSPIQGISQQITPLHSISKGIGGIKAGDEERDKFSFNNILMSHIKSVSDTCKQSVADKDKLVRGELKNPHDAAISGMKAGIMLRLTTNICSKISSACTTLFQMQI